MPAVQAGTIDAVRAAFARVATNVAVVTAPGPHRCTANVWAEAPEPPLLLVTLRRAGATHRAVTESGRFAVSVLADDQEEVARRSAGPREQRFTHAALTSGPLGLPLVDGALAVFECSVRAVHWFGAYDIVVGAVDSVDASNVGRPLVYGDARFLVAESRG